MGNKKKTKWRKVPSADLSQITVKNSIVEKTRANDKLYADGKRTSDTKHIESNNVPEYYNPEEFPSPDQSRTCEQNEKSVATNEDSNRPSGDEVSGIYVNGLWIPVSQQKKNFAAAVPENILRTTPFMVPPSSVFCPSTCPRFQTIHAPDVPLHPNYFVPSSNHYLYYFFKGPPNSSADVGNGRPDCPIDENDENDYREFGNSRHFNHSHALSTKSAEREYEGRERGDSVSSAQYPDCVPTSHQQDFVESQEAPMYYYPGYAFGQQLCSVPLVSFVPPASVRVHSSHPWPVGPVQRKRRRRRKGYAEYAVIPPKKNNPDSQTCSHNSVQRLNSNCRDPENNQIGKESSTECIPSKGDCKTGEPATRALSSPHFTEDKGGAEKNLLLYASTLCDKILSIARSELHSNNKASSEKHSLGTILDDEELHDICKNALHSIIDEIVSAHNFSIFHRPAGDIKAMLHSDPNCEIVQKQLINDAVKQHREDVKVHARRGCEPLQEDRQTNVSKSSTPEHDEINSDMKLVDKENFNDSKSKESGIGTQNNRQVLNEMNGRISEDDGLLNCNGEVSQKIFESTLTSPVTQQPRSETSGQVCFIQPQNFKSGEEERAPANEMNISEDGSIDLNREKKSIGNESNHQNLKFTVKSENEAIAVNENTGENHDINSTKEFAPQVDAFTRDVEPSHDRLSHSVPSSFASHLVSSEALLRETELELSKLHQLTSNTALHATQSIYKLAYDENFTDQSENEDLEVAPQPQQQTRQNSTDNHTCSEMCRPLQTDVMSSEILVHEADSASEAGSEDVELLPHRYQSESVQDYNKHIYVNNLSLAVEMLRTHENLPYDDEFKRIVDEDSNKNTERVNPSFYTVDLNNATGRVNPAFVEEISSNQAVRNNFKHERMPELHSFHASRSSALNQRSDCRTSIADSGVQSGDSGDEMIEEAKEVLCPPPDIKQPQWHMDQTASYRRFGQQTRQQFRVYTPRASILNPCLCCIIM